MCELRAGSNPPHSGHRYVLGLRFAAGRTTYQRARWKSSLISARSTRSPRRSRHVGVAQPQRWALAGRILPSEGLLTHSTGALGDRFGDQRLARSRRRQPDPVASDLDLGRAAAPGLCPITRSSTASGRTRTSANSGSRHPPSSVTARTTLSSTATATRMLNGPGGPGSGSSSPDALTATTTTSAATAAATPKATKNGQSSGILGCGVAIVNDYD